MLRRYSNIHSEQHFFYLLNKLYEYARLAKNHELSIDGNMVFSLFKFFATKHRLDRTGMIGGVVVVSILVLLCNTVCL